jgi:REP element-mobilizing transposase RayT
MGTKHHRLPRECYRGKVAASFTVCLNSNDPFFVHTSIVQLFRDFLKKVADKHAFSPIYCFMPDHVHLIFIGHNAKSDVLRGLEAFKQATGYFLAKNYPQTYWEKSFYDRIIRSKELGATIRYVLDNPVRGRLVAHWREYPFTGAIGLDLETLLENLASEWRTRAKARDYIWIAPRLWMAPRLIAPRLWMALRLIAPRLWMAPRLIAPRLWMAPRLITPRVWMVPRLIEPRLWMAPRLIEPRLWMAPRLIAPRLWMAPRLIAPRLWMAPCLRHRKCSRGL